MLITVEINIIGKETWYVAVNIHKNYLCKI